MIRFYKEHDDVIKWKHFSALLALCEGNHRLPVNSPHKDQWHGALIFYVHLNKRLSNPNVGDLRRHGVHCDVTVMNKIIYDIRIFVLSTDGIITDLCPKCKRVFTKFLLKYFSYGRGEYINPQQIIASSHQAITCQCWLSTVRSSNNHPKTISREINQPLVDKISLKMTYLKCYSNLLKANELISDKVWR